MSFHFIHPQKPQKKTSAKRLIVDIETNGLNAGNYVFGVLMDMDTGEHWVHRNPLALRSQLEGFAPAVCYAHNAFGFDAWAFYNKMEVKNAQKLWKGSKLLSFKVEGIEWRDSTDLMAMRLGSIGDALGFRKALRLRSIFWARSLKSSRRILITACRIARSFGRLYFNLKDRSVNGAEKLQAQHNCPEPPLLSHIVSGQACLGQSIGDMLMTRRNGTAAVVVGLITTKLLVKLISEAGFRSSERLARL